MRISHREYSHPEIDGVPGSQVFETSRNWELICSCTREVLSAVEPNLVAAVTATSMREGMVLYDARGDEIWACPNVDSRAGAEAAELVRRGVAQEIYDRAGDWVSITAPARFLWLAKHQPEIFGAVSHIGMLGDWILKKLCDVFVTDRSLGSSSGMFDLADRDWSEWIIDIVGLERRAFPEVVESGSVIGGVSAEAAAATSLPEGTPVVVGGADTQLGLVGIGVVDPGQFAVVGGTFWQHAVLLDEPLIDRKARLRTLCHTVDGQWMMEGVGFYSGLAMRWFRDAFCQTERTEAQLLGRDPYALLEDGASSVPPGANGIFGIFSNLMNARHWVHASPAFIGLDLSAPERSGKGACLRAIEEAAAYVSMGHFRIAEEISGRTVEHVTLAGGAAQGTLWPQILADVLGVPVRIPVVKEATALGAAAYAGLGVGLYEDLRCVTRLVQIEREVKPGEEAHIAYIELYKRWLEIYSRSLDLSEAGLTRPLWRAAGT